MLSGIYCIENKITGNKYIGQSADVESRMNAYHQHCIALLDAFKKYGEENFIKYIVEYCSIDKLDDMEQYFIKEFKSHVSENGYNLSWGGEGNRGKKRTAEQIKNISLAHAGLHHTNEAKKENRGF